MKLDYFENLSNFRAGLQTLFEDLNVPVHYIDNKSLKPKDVLSKTYKDTNPSYQLMDDVYILGLVDDAAFEKYPKHPALESMDKIKKSEKDYDGILIFGVTLKEREKALLPTRTQLAEITRAFNREYYYTPVVVVFRYENFISLANAERLKYKQKWPEGEKAGKVSILRDIDLTNPHTGHLKILEKLHINRSCKKEINSFGRLYQSWQDVFSVNLLSKEFYSELSNWYFWAIEKVTFPSEPTINSLFSKTGTNDNSALEAAKQEDKAQSVIRLLTRLLFVWFIKEKKLIPEELFDLSSLQKNILKKIEPHHEEELFKEDNIASIYYKAILQNLFFATLNCPITPDSVDTRERGFRGDETYGKHRGVDYLMRYKKHFKDPTSFLKMVNEVVPFLNGGLFECLDDKENNTYIDGFSDSMTKGNTLIVPDYLFFGKEAEATGLISILKSYKFTIAENTPIEEDVALDPELLGKVFENLLASYNPETKISARKQTGSFYTPREIVNYMVDESLIAHLKKSIGSFQLPDLETKKQDGFYAFLNPNDEIEITQGNLPHWNQSNSWYFVTFRLADSIPKEKIDQLKQEREQWIKKNGKENKKEYTKEELKEYYRLFSERVEEWMNAGYGSCVLKDTINAKIISDGLNHFNKERYLLDEWVVMPNHVHVLVRPKQGYTLSDIMHSWKSFTANKINKNIKTGGQLWMHESYDHIVRNEKALHAIRKYIRENPRKANIVTEASSFLVEGDNNTPKRDALNNVPQSKDALDTILRKLVSFDPVNPFEKNHNLSKKIIHSLDSCKILDPACGSGAFPMGMLQKMVHILQKIDPDNRHWKELQREKAKAETDKAYKIDNKTDRQVLLSEIDEAFDQSINNPDYARKLFLIENSIYGVDIQPIATQISKLRFFISLVVEQKVNRKKENFGIRPLPNLETKFVTANTLIGIEKPDAQMSLFDTKAIELLELELKTIRHKLFGAKTKTTKVKYRKRDKELRTEIARELKKKGWGNKSAEQLASWDPYNQNGVSPFFNSEWMFDIKEGFDVVIGNPPYVQIQKFSGQQCQKDWTNEKYKTFVKTGDIYSLFYEKGNLLLRNGGILTFITSNKWMRANYGKATRKFFLENSNIQQIIDFGDSPIFENATTYTNILIFSKEQNRNKILAWDLSKEYKSNKTLESMLEDNGSCEGLFSEESFVIIPTAQATIKKRIEEIGTPLKDWDVSIYRGVLTGLNEAFVINGEKKGELVAKDPKSAEIIKPILRGRDVKRYKADFADLWLINSHNGYGNVPPVNICNYPAIKKHLDSFEPKVSKRYDQGNTPYNLRNCAYLLEFEKERIAWPETAVDNQFTIVASGYMQDKTSFFMAPANGFLLAVLNSPISRFFFVFLVSKMRGGYFSMSKIYVEQIPIPKTSKEKQLPFEILVDCILFAKKNNLEMESQTFESVIDGMVYDLYFEEEMKKAHCYITDRISEVIKPFKPDDNDEFKKEYIKKFHSFCRNDKIIFRRLIHRRNVKVVEIISGDGK